MFFFNKFLKKYITEGRGYKKSKGRRVWMESEWENHSIVNKTNDVVEEKIKSKQEDLQLKTVKDWVNSPLEFCMKTA